VFDPSGYWVPLITEDWRFRMVTPPKGDVASVPLNAEGRRVADTWDLAKDDAAGNQCKAFGVGGILRQPGRLHITWDNDNTLKMEFDAGQQTRLLHFEKGQPPAEKTWQGYSVAEWDVPPAGGRGAPGNAAGSAGPAVPPGGGAGQEVKRLSRAELDADAGVVGEDDEPPLVGVPSGGQEEVLVA